MSSTDKLLEDAFSKASRIGILGCGSFLRGDDAAGSAIAQNLLDTLGDGSAAFGDGSEATALDPSPMSSKPAPGLQIQVFMGDVAPESLTGEIKRFNPDLLLIIDAIDMGLAPGDSRIILTEEVGGVSFSGHILPLPILIDYLEREIGCLILLLGIQTESLEFLAEMTPAVAFAVAELSNTIHSLLTK
ncbi:MAG: hydrogenase maturation protease [Eggerthellaceae bacterium]|nr:hydrogenase maturation protease [Eggerthellaceae bacterium]